ncbi:MAG: hypothetical protein JRI44_13830, partial [Deltaproteobacteria bacterium]|nr:hypothetical protein [Deltaproteobacteria bacterium]
MRKLMVFFVIVVFFSFVTGCSFIEDLLGDSETYGSIEGEVQVPENGVQKPLGKVNLNIIKYKPANGAKVYLIPKGTSFKQHKPRSDYKNQTTDTSGKFKFTNLPIGAKYNIVVDLPPYGNADSVMFDLEADTDENYTESTTFIRKLNEENNLILSVKLDKVNYIHGETITAIVKGYTDKAINVHIEIWNEKQKGSFIWKSDEKSIKADTEINETFTKVIPGSWPATNSSSGADYKVYAVVGTSSLKGSDNFNILGDEEGDTEAPTETVTLNPIPNIITDTARLSWTKATNT